LLQLELPCSRGVPAAEARGRGRFAYARDDYATAFKIWLPLAE
jgi:hypothetical protein